MNTFMPYIGAIRARGGGGGASAPPIFFLTQNSFLGYRVEEM